LEEDRKKRKNNEWSAEAFRVWGERSEDTGGQEKDLNK